MQKSRDIKQKQLMCSPSSLRTSDKEMKETIPCTYFFICVAQLNFSFLLLVIKFVSPEHVERQRRGCACSTQAVAACTAGTEEPAPAHCSFTESWNGLDWKDLPRPSSSNPPTMTKDTFLQTWLLKASINLAFDTCRHEASTTSLEKSVPVSHFPHCHSSW